MYCAKLIWLNLFKSASDSITFSEDCTPIYYIVISYTNKPYPPYYHLIFWQILASPPILSIAFAFYIYIFFIAEA